MTNDIISATAPQPEADPEDHLFDSWFDPIEHAVRDRVRSFIEELFEWELAAVLARPRYGRRTKDDGAVKPDGVAGHRHGRRTRRLIESDPTIGLIERPEYKRRWSAPVWEEMERDALRAWLLDRLEDARFWPASEPHILSAQALADATRHDPDFLSVADLYAGRAGFDLEALVAELVATESAPFLAALRYTESGLRKRADWEATWEKQRAQDAIDAKVDARRDEFARAAWARMNPREEGEAAEAYAALSPLHSSSHCSRRFGASRSLCSLDPATSDGGCAHAGACSGRSLYYS